MTDEIFDPLPGDGYPDGAPPPNFPGWGVEDDVGPPAPGEWNEKDYPNPEPEMEC